MPIYQEIHECGELAEFRSASAFEALIVIALVLLDTAQG
jgi:hypothetical protein